MFIYSDTCQHLPDFVADFGRIRQTVLKRNYELRLSVCLSVRMEQLGSQWTDLREIV
jgi:hypothetical protein